MPRSAYARWTKPEQSSPTDGLVPPKRYGTPRYFLALATTLSPVALPAVAAADVDCIVDSSVVAKSAPDRVGVEVLTSGRRPRVVRISWIRAAISATVIAAAPRVPAAVPATPRRWSGRPPPW